MFSLLNLENGTIIIANNTFRNISTIGPLIYLEEAIQQVDTALVVIDNIFDLILTYTGPAAIQVKR